MNHLKDSENVTVTVPEVKQSTRNSSFSRTRSSSFSGDEERFTSPPPNKRPKHTFTDPQVDSPLSQEFVKKSTNPADNMIDVTNSGNSNKIKMEIDNIEETSSIEVSPATQRNIRTDHAQSSSNSQANSICISRDETENDPLDIDNIDSEKLMSNACSQSPPSMLPSRTTIDSSDKCEQNNFDAECEEFEKYLKAIKEMTYQCEICDKRFKRKINLRIHTEMMHDLEISE